MAATGHLEDCSTRYKYIVIGGGIAGVTCAQTLSTLCPEERILLITASSLIKAVTNYRKITKTLEEFDVEERPMFEVGENYPNVDVKKHIVSDLNSSDKRVTTEDHVVYHYDRLCLCTGGVPKLIASENPFIIGIRDTETVQVFQKRLQNARRIVVIGNGGIATELVYEIENCDVIWAIKDKAITSTFIDGGASQFFLPLLQMEKPATEGHMKRTKYKIIDGEESANQPVVDTGQCGAYLPLGGALGPDWHDGVTMKGSTQTSHHVHIEYRVEVDCLLSPEQLKESRLTPQSLHGELTGGAHETWPVYVKLTNGTVYGCDFVVSATGVVPATAPFLHNNQFSVNDEDGGINVDNNMQTSVPHVYAAGDVCHANWEKSPFWVQMRLWSQARQMGSFAAQCMVAHSSGEQVDIDFCFEVFAHVTKFFNHKVVLLGKFNGQGMGQDQELLVRITKGVEYIKVVLQDGHMHGALMIGDTDMEETFENLILNQMDLTPFKDNLLNPDIDIDDFFD